MSGGMVSLWNGLLQGPAASVRAVGGRRSFSTLGV